MEIEGNCPQENNGFQNQPSQEILAIFNEKETNVKEKNGRKEKGRKEKGRKEKGRKEKGRKQNNFYNSKKEKRREGDKETWRKKEKTEERIRYKLGPNANSISISPSSYAKDHAPQSASALYGKIEKLEKTWLKLHDYLIRLWNNTPIATKRKNVQCMVTAPKAAGKSNLRALAPPAAILPLDQPKNDSEQRCQLRGLGWKDDDMKDDAPPEL